MSLNHFQSNNYIGMSRIPNTNMKELSPYARNLKQSSFITQLEMQRKERIASIRPNRKQLSSSTLFDPDSEQTKVNTPSKNNLQQPDNLRLIDDELKRARSLKLVSFQKPAREGVEKKATIELNENVVRLKLQEMTFKFKTKVSVLLKQIMIPHHELTKFSSLMKIDEILDFLSERVKQKLTNQQISEVNIQKALSKEKNTLNNYETEMESLKKKLQEKEVNEKTLKTKLRDSNTELRQIYDKLNTKQKQLSTKVTQLYQLKTTLKETEKMLEKLQKKYDLLCQETKVERNMFTDQSNDIIYNSKNILEENTKLLEKLRELQEELQVTEQKQKTLTEINNQLNLEVKRWRERFEDGSILEDGDKRSSLLDSTNQKDFVEVLVVPSNELRKSTMSLHNQISNMDSSSRRVSLTALEIENLKLSSRVQDLERQNKQFSRDLVNYGALKEQYEKILAASSQSTTSIKEKSFNKIQSFKESPIVLQQVSLDPQYQKKVQEQYQKKVQEVAKEWKDKLYEIVNNYEDQLELVKKKIDELTKEKQQLEKKVLENTNQKYQLENKLVGHEQQIYELLKAYKNACGVNWKEESLTQGSQEKQAKGSVAVEGSREAGHLV